MSMMQIPLSILLELLPCEHDFPGAEEKRISRVSILRAAPEEPIGETDGCLYVCRLSEALALSPRWQDALFFCARDTDAPLLPNIIAAGGAIGVAGLFCLLQDRLTELQQWNCAMMDMVYQNRSLQDILDLSVPVIGNNINISDSAFRRVASTDALCPEDDPICVALRQNGFHPKETVRRFFETDRYGLWNRTDYYIDDSRSVSKYTLVGKIYKFHNTYFTHVVMTCNYHAPTPGLLARYRMLLECIGLVVAKDWAKSDAFVHTYDAFLSDIISGNLDVEQIIELRAKYVGLSATGLFVLVNIPVTLSGNYSTGRLGQELTNTFPTGKVLYYHGSILLLNLLDKKTADSQIAEMKRLLREFLPEYGLRCGISARFSHLKRLRNAYQQTARVLEIMHREKKECPLADGCIADCCFHLDEAVYSFNDCYEYCSLDLSEEALRQSEGSAYFQALVRLFEYDSSHHMNNLQLLRVYLQCERSLSMTSQLMHMHRNNAAYRIRRIEEMIGLDLNDPSCRLRLQIAYLQYNILKGPDFA